MQTTKILEEMPIEDDPIDREIDFSRSRRNPAADRLNGTRAVYGMKDGRIIVSMVPIQDPPSEEDLKVYSPEEVCAIVEARYPNGLDERYRAALERSVARTLAEHLDSIKRP